MPNRNAEIVRRWAQWLLLVSFITGMGFTSYRTYLHLIDDIRENERADVKRLRAFNPSKTRSWKHLPEDFEPAFENRVEGRDLAVRRFARFKLNTLGVSSNPRVIIGKDGWLFYHHEAEPTYFSPADPQLAKIIDEWAVALPEWRRWLADRNIQLLVVIAPNKQQIYPDKLPTFQQKLLDDAPLQQLSQRWQSADPKLQVVHLFAPLFAAAIDQQVYFKTDTHWNTDGMLVGYRKAVQALGMVPLGPEAFQSGPGPTKVGDLTVKLGYWNEPPEPFTHWELRNPRAKPVSVDIGGDEEARLDYLDTKAWERAGGGPRAVFFHDSFGAGFFSELLAEHFGRMVAVPSNHLDPGIIEREQPNIVILEIVERQFQGIGARGPFDPPRRSMVR